MNTATIQGAPQRPPPATKRKSRMSVDNMTDGLLDQPPRTLWYGDEKTGKSTAAAGAPSPVWLGAEKGTGHLRIQRMPEPETWEDVLEGIQEIRRVWRSKGWKTLVLDPMGWIENLLADYCQAKTAGERNKYAAGDLATRERRVFLAQVEQLWNEGMGIVMIAHAKVRKFNDPEGEGYDRYELDMPPTAALLYKQWVDAVIFVKPDRRGVKLAGKTKGSGSNVSYMHTVGTFAYDAGNRWSLPPKLPLSWAALDAARLPEVRAAAIREEIEQSLASLEDAELTAKVRGYLDDPNTSLIELQNALAAKLAEKAEQAETEESTKATDTATEDDTENEGDTEQ